MKNSLKYTVLVTVFLSLGVMCKLACADNSRFHPIRDGETGLSSDGGSSVRYSSGRASDSRFLQGRKSVAHKQALGRGWTSARGLKRSTGMSDRRVASTPILPILRELPAASVGSERLTPSQSVEWLEDVKRVGSAREALEWLEELNEEYPHLHEITFKLMYKLHKYINFVMTPQQLSGYQICILYLLTGKLSPVYNRAWDDDIDMQGIVEKPIEKPVITDEQRVFLRKLLALVSRQAVLKTRTRSLAKLLPEQVVAMKKNGLL